MPTGGTPHLPRHAVRVRRVYDGVDPADGARVLVDRIWPRGLTRDSVRLTEWIRDVAPSTDLRRWYGHDPAKFAEFRQRYLTELDDADRAAALDHIRALAGAGPVTLLTATRDVEHSHAAVLADLVRTAG